MRKAVCFCLLALLLMGCVSAVDVTQSQEDALGLDSLEQAVPQQAKDLLGDLSPKESVNFASGLKKVFTGSFAKSTSSFKNSLITCSLMVLICILTSMVNTIDQDRPIPVSTLVGLLAITSLCSSGLSSMVSQCTQTLEEVLTLNNLLLPVMAGASAAAGNITASTAIYAGTVFFSNILMKLILKLMIPLTYAYIAISLVSNALNMDTMGRMSNFIGWIITIGLKAVLYIFTGYLAITGIISGTGDAAAIKAAKLALSGMVPVVGSIMSDASETVLASAMLVRNCAGTFGLLAVLAVCLGPFLKIASSYLMLKLTAAVCVAVGTPPLIKQIDALSKAMGYLLAMTGVYGLLTLISCVCSMQVSCV